MTYKNKVLKRLAKVSAGYLISQFSPTHFFFHFRPLNRLREKTILFV